MRVGILTGGGDCPGLNAVIRAVVRKIHNAGGNSIGVMEGWRGMIEDITEPLDVQNTDQIIARGGTILGSSRTNPFKSPANVEKVKATFLRHRLDALVAIGGEDTLGVAHKLFEQEKLPTVGVPKTIDNDLSATDFTFGFDTAINIVVEAVDRLRTTAESHRRVMVVETMGRHAGWIACLSGIAVAADYILIPEQPINFEHLCKVLQERRDQGKMYSMVVASEGAQFPEAGAVTTDANIDEFGHVKLGGIGEVIAGMLERRLNIETRHVTLGHLQRGGPPSAYDRVLATRFGLKAAELVLNGKFGRMAALTGNDITSAPLAEAVNATKRLELKYYEEAQEWFMGAV
jgi:ATP-dependent phosphofructokinase / diphosphate-dependent phosphofructokinase